MVDRRRPFVRSKLRAAGVVAKMRAPPEDRHMNAAADTDDSSDEQRRSRRLRFELIFASLWLAFGLFVLPALIFFVGAAALGPYGEKAGLSTFYIDFYGDLADTSGRAWSIALGPLLLIYSLRAVFIGVRPKQLDDEEAPPPRSAPKPRAAAPKESKRAARVEPRMSGD
jgi:hypothetical protein